MNLCNYLFEPCWFSLTLITLGFIAFQTILMTLILRLFIMKDANSSINEKGKGQ